MFPICITKDYRNRLTITTTAKLKGLGATMNIHPACRS